MSIFYEDYEYEINKIKCHLNTALSYLGSLDHYFRGIGDARRSCEITSLVQSIRKDLKEGTLYEN